jgi:pimeloyl-ACP methyl ester carboxylesterase
MKLKQKWAMRYTRAQLNILSLVSLRKTAIKAFRAFITPGKRRKRKRPAIFGMGEPLAFKMDGHVVRGHRWQPYSDSVRPDPAGEAPRKVLLAHGFASSSAIFEPYITALLKKGCEVVAFDAPGHGWSGGKRVFVTDYTRMLGQADQIYGPFHSWLGHSLGGLALALWLEDAPFESGHRCVLLAPAPGLSAAVGEWAAAMRLPVAVVAEMDEQVKETTGHPFSWYSLRRVIGSIGAQILYVQDELDEVVTPREARSIESDAHRNVDFHFTSGLGHKKLYKDAGVLNRVVEFL